jgi:hypothetical protein
MGAQAAALPAAGGGGGREQLDPRAQKLDELCGGEEGVGDRAAAVERHGSDDLVVELGDEHRVARAGRAVELGEAHERGGVLRHGAAQHEVVARRDHRRDRRGVAGGTEVDRGGLTVGDLLGGDV